MTLIICDRCNRSLLVDSPATAVQSWGWTVTDLTSQPMRGVCHQCQPKVKPEQENSHHGA